MSKDKRVRCECKTPKPKNSVAIPGTIFCEECFEVISHENEKPLPKERSEKKEKKAEVKVERIKRIDFSGVGIDINKIYNEDCRDTIAKVKDKQVDYVFTSPPYNVGLGFAKYEGGKQNKDNMGQQEYLDWSIQIIDSLLRITDKHVFWNVQPLTNNRVALFSLEEHYKYKIKDLCIWVKRSVAPASTRGVMSSAFEYIYVFSNQEPELRRFKDANFHGSFSNVIEVSREQNQYADVHKATFPLDLPRKFMHGFGDKGDLWFDPFMGTGTTARAAILEKKNFIGSELSKKYFELCNKEVMKFYKEHGNKIQFEAPKKSDKKVEQLNLEI